MKLLKAIFSTFKWALMPTCNHPAGICIAGQGRKCKILKDTEVVKKEGVEIQRTNYKIIDRW